MSAMQSFEMSEFQERIQRTKRRMEAEGLEVLLITDPANMNYLTGYDGWSFYVDQMVVVIIDEEHPLWIGRQMDANGAKATTWLYRENIISYTDDYVHSDVKHPMDFVADILRQIGQGNRVIGVEMGAYYFSALAFEHLKKGLPNAVWKNATLLVNHVRMIKSDQEIAYIRRAARLVEGGMTRAIQSIAEGVRECDVVGDIYQSLIRGTPEFGGDYPAIVPMLPSGENTCTPHLTWTDKKYRDKDLVIIELAGCYKRYHCPMARTVSIGPQEERVNDIARVVVEGLERSSCLCEAWRDMRGSGGSLAQNDREIRRHQGFPDRVFDGTELSAGLGRTYGEHQAGGSNRSEAEYGISYDSRNLV